MHATRMQGARTQQSRKIPLHTAGIARVFAQQAISRMHGLAMFGLCLSTCPSVDVRDVYDVRRRRKAINEYMVAP